MQFSLKKCGSKSQSNLTYGAWLGFIIKGACGGSQINKISLTTIKYFRIFCLTSVVANLNLIWLKGAWLGFITSLDVVSSYLNNEMGENWLQKEAWDCWNQPVNLWIAKLFFQRVVTLIERTLKWTPLRSELKLWEKISLFLHDILA